MVLKNVLDLIKSIEECRQDMYKLTKNRSFSDPEVVNISQQLDVRITKLQKIIYELRSLPKEKTVILVHK
ncbi:aspartyl-phosphate phosphatase Spo0E family protein [Peribacillus sp. NPDC058002]|uniref:aspartyl-phosphate phosphatase Spo0E family protein n=1 Tax=Peribacillus sp. NPDC058002 TaxID=3346301 RepID=UPI0036DEB8DA